MSAALTLVACAETAMPSKFNTNGDVPLEQGVYPPDQPSCENTDVCAVWGWCGVRGQGNESRECIAVSDEKCAQSRACKVSGLCKFQVDRCVAKSDDDCQNSQYCQWNGLCSESEGICK